MIRHGEIVLFAKNFVYVFKQGRQQPLVANPFEITRKIEKRKQKKKEKEKEKKKSCMENEMRRSNI